ncbi:MAG TPA: formylglycine-generating enzyme family protein [Polyangiaceae bacterium]|nr:formylglycine-generating enzyme family protein [Polyangiaceae bacterium]
MNRLGVSLLVGLLATSGCAALYGVGELTPGAPDQGGAGTGGAPTPSTAGAKPSASPDGGATSPIGGGGSTFPIGSGGTSAGSDNDGGRSSPATDGGALDTVQPPSCVGLPALCGNSESSSRDCCASLEVTGGSFFRSYDGLAGAGWDDPSSPAAISAFRLDAYEVTVGRFRRFVEAYPWLPPAGAGRNPANQLDFGWSGGWNALLPPDAESLSRALSTCASENSAQPSMSTWTVIPDANETLPVNCLTWFEAFAFCAWDGGRLPSEAEWNYAAAGGSQARVYPWASSLSTDVDPNYAVYQTPIAMVGSKPLGNGRFGHSDLAGNVWEWAVDWYRQTYSVPCEDCAELAADADISDRVLRGGAYYNQPPFLRAAIRGNAPPSTRNSGYGVRCARE